MFKVSNFIEKNRCFKFFEFQINLLIVVLVLEPNLKN